MFTRNNYELIYPIIENHLCGIKKDMIDFAILGSSSGHYGWKEVRFCDYDLWIYCESISSTIMLNIRRMIDEINKTFQKENILLIAGAVNGPYKPEIWELGNQDVLFLHLLVDDKISYDKRSIFTKLCWSKYKAHNTNNLLKNLMDKEPTFYDLLHSKCGILNTIKSLQSGIIEYDSLDLITGEKKILSYTRYSAQYIEFILHSIMTIARNRMRLLRKKEADYLENKEFAKWYGNMYSESFIQDIVHLKSNVSNNGYHSIENVSMLEDGAIKWLQKLKNEIEVMV